MKKHVKLSDVIRLIDDDIERCEIVLERDASEKYLHTYFFGRKIGLEFLKFELQNFDYYDSLHSC